MAAVAERSSFCGIFGIYSLNPGWGQKKEGKSDSIMA
jgi:hypothetical protein